HDLRLAAREQRRTMRARSDADLTRDLADVLRAATVRATLLDRDLAANELLVDRLRGLLDVLAGDRVLLHRLVTVGGRRCDRKRQLYLLLDPGEEEMPLGRLELLGVLLGVGQGLEVVLELLADGTRDGLLPKALQDQRQTGADLHPLDDLVLGRLHRQRRTDLLDDLLDRSRPLTQAVRRDPLPDRVAVLALELLGQLGVEPFRLADLQCEVF